MSGIATEVIVTTILLPLLLSGQPELDVDASEIFACGSTPIQTVIAQDGEPSACNATGLRAAKLNELAFAGFNRRSDGARRLACNSIKNYRGCGFPLEIQGPNAPMLCDELQISINEIGVVAGYSDIDDLCTEF